MFGFARFGGQTPLYSPLREGGKCGDRVSFASASLRERVDIMGLV